MISPDILSRYLKDNLWLGTDKMIATSFLWRPTDTALSIFFSDLCLVFKKNDSALNGKQTLYILLTYKTQTFDISLKFCLYNDLKPLH